MGVFDLMPLCVVTALDVVVLLSINDLVGLELEELDFELVVVFVEVIEVV